MGDQTDSVKDTLTELGAELDYQLADDDWTKKSIWRPVRQETRIAIATGIVVAVALVVAGATVLFSHTFPSGVTGAHLTTSCTTLTMGTPSGLTSGSVRFNCGGSTPAIVADGSGPVTPGFQLTGTLYTSLTLVSSAAVGTACSGGTVLTSGSAVTPAVGNYDYCASYVGSGALTGFSLTWSQ